ncbi:MAG TPA: L-rhamnose/proton symporter RhaT [Terriglobia bacterium]|nr:L-rhamnose/proton symporter RhaT [Terriglobia bacterium]
MSAASNTGLVIVWILIAGILQGAFALPMGYARKWKWENIWLSYSVLAFLVLPLAMILATPSHFLDALRSAPPAATLRVGLFGFGWGMGAVFFGLGIEYAGMALGMSVMTGLIDALGTLIPMAILSPGVLAESRGKLIVLATLITIVGVAICGYAGHLRERAVLDAPATTDPRKPLTKALAICVMSGILSAMFNFGYAFSGPVTQAAGRAGATPDAALNVVWMVILGCGLIPNAGYCIFLLQRNKSWPHYWRRGAMGHWALALIMAVMWLGGTLLYGVAGDRLGELGPSLGWATWNAVMIIASTGCGFLVGEWKHAGRRAMHFLWIGVGVLILSVVLLGFAGAGSM